MKILVLIVWIGNPPYVRQEILGEDFKSMQSKYKTFAEPLICMYIFSKSL